MSGLYRDMVPSELDVQYNARATVSVECFTEIMRQYASQSEQARQTLPCQLDVAYGSHVDERMDIFPAARKKDAALAPVFVFIHGGYWRALSKSDASNMAPAYTQVGAMYIALNYSLAPHVTLDTIVDQCRRAMAWIYHHIEQYGGDPERIYIGGSSAGGHLAGMVLAKGWHTSYDVPERLVKGALLLSGLYDLTPIPLTHINAWMQLSAEDAARNSPVNYEVAAGCPIVVSYGDNETNEFKRQSDDFLSSWKAKGYPGQYVQVAGLNHFDLVLECGKAQSPLATSVFAMMGLLQE
jgi:arylformamidase